MACINLHLGIPVKCGTISILLSSCERSYVIHRPSVTWPVTNMAQLLWTSFVCTVLDRQLSPKFNSLCYVRVWYLYCCKLINHWRVTTVLWYRYHNKKSKYPQKDPSDTATWCELFSLRFPDPGISITSGTKLDNRKSQVKLDETDKPLTLFW